MRRKLVEEVVSGLSPNLNLSQTPISGRRLAGRYIDRENKMARQSTMVDAGEETQVVSATERYQKRQRDLKGMSDDKLTSMIGVAEGLDESIRELALSALLREQTRRENLASRGGGSRAAQSEEHKAMLAIVRMALESAGLGSQVADVTVSFGFDADGQLVDEDIRRRAGPRVRASSFSCVVTRDGESNEFTSDSLKNLLVAVYPDTAGKRAMNPGAYFRVRGVDVFATKADDSQVLVNPTT